MPKVKIPRKSTWQDMTAMCDVAFLLLTFFMLTSIFTSQEPVLVATPASISEIKIPETNIARILVDPAGKVFFSLDGQENRINLLKKMGEKFSITFTDQECKEFSTINSFGVPIAQMKNFLALKPDQRFLRDNLLGIPADSMDNQLRFWIGYSRQVNPKIVIAIKADQTTPYPVVKKVFGTLQDLKENRFNLITALEENPLERSAK
jgi:biopolymer transport protein ExbD